MPVKTIKRGKKYRVIDTDTNKLCRRKPAMGKRTGEPCDGGGHTTKKAADNQSRAINASLSRAGKI